MNRCFDMGSVIDLQPQFPVRIIADGVVANQEIQWERELNSAEGRTTTVMARSLIRIAEDCQKRIRTGDKQVILPLLSYYGTGRLWAQKKEKSRRYHRALQPAFWLCGLPGGCVQREAHAEMVREDDHPGGYKQKKSAPSFLRSKPRYPNALPGSLVTPRFMQSTTWIPQESTFCLQRRTAAISAHP